MQQLLQELQDKFKDVEIALLELQQRTTVQHERQMMILQRLSKLGLVVSKLKVGYSAGQLGLDSQKQPTLADTNFQNIINELIEATDNLKNIVEGKTNAS